MYFCCVDILCAITSFFATLHYSLSKKHIYTSDIPVWHGIRYINYISVLANIVNFMQGCSFSFDTMFIAYDPIQKFDRLWKSIKITHISFCLFLKWNLWHESILTRNNILDSNFYCIFFFWIYIDPAIWAKQWFTIIIYSW